MYSPGEDVLVDIGDREHPAEVINHRGNWVLAVIRPDPLWDYGTATSRMDAARQTVCVPECRVRYAASENS